MGGVRRAHEAGANIYAIVLLIASLVIAVFGCSSEKDSEVLLASTNDSEATMGIGLRHKVYSLEGKPGNLIVTFGRSYGNLKISRDGGNSWEKFLADYRSVIRWRDFEAKTITPYIDFHFAMTADETRNAFFTFPSHADKRQNFVRYSYVDDQFDNTISMKDEEPDHHKRGTLLLEGNDLWAFTRTSNGEDISWKGNLRYHRSRDRGENWYSSESDFGYVEKFDQDVRVGALVWEHRPTIIVWLGRVFKYKYYQWDGKTWLAGTGGEISIREKHPLTRQFAAGVQNGDLHIVWQDEVAAGVLREDYKKSSEERWHEETVECNAGNENLLPMMTRARDILYVFYSFLEKDGRRNIYGRAKQDGKWSDRFRVSSTGNNCRHPNVPEKVPPGLDFIPIIWVEGTQPPYEVHFKRLSVHRQ